MGWFRRKPKAPERRALAPNPWKHWTPASAEKEQHYLSLVLRGAFHSEQANRLLFGWDSASQTIDYYLIQELRQLRARSRAMVRGNPYGKRFISTVKANVVGPQGVQVQARSLRLNGELDTPANDAIEAAWREWGHKHCDYLGRHTWQDIQNLCIACAAQDGEFLVRKHYTGRHKFQLQVVDPELLDVEKNEEVGDGEIRLGVEYDATGRRVRYHFKKKTHPVSGGYDNYDEFSVAAGDIIHGFISEWPDQSRGTPWMHASLERSKHLEKYEEAAIVKARSTAATMAFLRSQEGDAYEGEESFVKAHLQGIASGLGISYHSLSNDLEGVNYSSIRAGVLEDREVFKGLQNWFIRTLVQPVYEQWVTQAVGEEAIRIGRVPLRKPIGEYYPAHYQARRWAWVDPQKDGAANQMAIDNMTKSRSAIIREQGDDPENVFREIKAEQDMLDALGLVPVSSQTEVNDEPQE